MKRIVAVPGNNSASRPPDAYDASPEIVATLGPVRGPFTLGLLIAIALWGLVAWGYQLYRGLAVTAMNNYFCWGVYIINFIFFIGVSMAGTLISAVLRLTGAGWRHPITRMAEGITLFSLLVAGPMIIIDMGRPDRFFSVFKYGRIQSPILWDVFSLISYLAGSLLYLYLPLIPDLALLRDHGHDFSAWRRRMYSILALGWRGTPEQHQRLDRAIAIMAIAIIPVAISIHTVTAWIFGMTLRPGWHSTIIGPDFVVGALYSGIATVILAMAFFRRFFGLDRHITAEHFKKLGMLLLVVCLAYFYFTVNEYIGSEYTNQGIETHLLDAVFSGSYATQFWSMATLGLIIPALLLGWPTRHKVGAIITASVFINIGMWLMRYIIVVPTLATPFVPTPEHVKLVYVPTWVEWSITVGGFAAFGSMYIIFSKLFPIVSIWETALDHAPAQSNVEPPHAAGEATA